MDSILKRLTRLGDEYDRRTRLQPALIVVLPAALAFGVMIAEGSGGWDIMERVGLGTLVSVASSVGLALLVQLGRDQGKRKEPGLWKSWGGPPTTRMLRHREVRLTNPVNRMRYHAKLKRLVPNIRLPGLAEETANPGAADQVYEACVGYLKNATRDRAKFPLVFAENVNYGFRRNLWGMRGAGIVFSALGVVASVMMASVAWASGDVIWVVATVIALGDACLLSWWLIRIRPSWVFVPAKAYAERLLESCDSLQKEEE